MSHQKQRDTYRLQLTILESGMLEEVLDQAIGSTQRPSPTVLKTAQEKLQDAKAVALWLGEEVTVDVEPNELRACLEAIDSSMRKLDRTGEGRVGLEHLWHRLSPALPVRGGAVPAGDCPLPCGCVHV